jgi:hypothetical protein
MKNIFRAIINFKANLGMEIINKKIADSEWCEE